MQLNQEQTLLYALLLKSPIPDLNLTLLKSVGGKLRIPNLTEEPKVLKRHQHFGQILPVFILTDREKTISHPSCTNHGSTEIHVKHSEAVQVDPDHILPEEIKNKFTNLLSSFDEVFNPKFKAYNDAAGSFTTKVNMGPVKAPQSKGRVRPTVFSQQIKRAPKFDELERSGFFKPRRLCEET